MRPLLLTTFFLLGCIVGRHAPADDSFVHPGLLHGSEDLQRIRQHLDQGQEPWSSALRELSKQRTASSDWRLAGPFRRVVRSPEGSPHNQAMELDACAAYQNALMWSLTGDRRHADKAIEILNAWGSTLEEMGGRDVQLAAGLNGFLIVNAAELMRWTDSGWPERDARQFEAMLRRAVYPPIKDFATFANGNWDAACIKTMMAIGVYCDDRAMFDRAVDYFRAGSGNGRVTHYVINETGQCQESGRDQQHTQLGLGLLAEACEVAYHQGVDLYGYADNRLLRGFEYTAKYLSGETPPFVPHTDTTGKYRHREISEHGRGRLRPIFEMSLNHYQNRAGIDAPYTAWAAEQSRPEGAAVKADHPGFGTLMYYQAAP